VRSTRAPAVARAGNVNVCDDRQETVLHKICRIPPQEPGAWRDLLVALKQADIEIDYMDKRGKTALFTAAEYGRKDIVNWLITNGADINWLSNEWQTILHQVRTAPQRGGVSHGGVCALRFDTEGLEAESSGREAHDAGPGARIG
jgi:hypothetical protein